MVTLMLMVRPRLRSGQEDNGPQSRFFLGMGRRLWKTQVGRWRGSRRGGGNLSSVSHYNVAVAIVIREFQTEDFEILWRMDQACFLPGIAYSKAELKSFMRHRGSFTLVAADGNSGKLAGFIVAYGGPMGHVITIDVDPSARRSGVGSLMLRAAEERLRAAGASAVGLETAVDNRAALSFYKRHGYNVIRTWPRYYSNGVDALVMKKDLGGGST